METRKNETSIIEIVGTSLTAIIVIFIVGFVMIAGGMTAQKLFDSEKSFTIEDLNCKGQLTWMKPERDSRYPTLTCITSNKK